MKKEVQKLSKKTQDAAVKAVQEKVAKNVKKAEEKVVVKKRKEKVIKTDVLEKRKRLKFMEAEQNHM